MDKNHSILSMEGQIKEAKTIIGQQQMNIQTLESQKLDFIKAMKERDVMITKMQADHMQLSQEKKHLQEVIQTLKQHAVGVFTEVDTLNQRCITLEKQHEQREFKEKENLDKVQSFTDRFQFMSCMVQKLDTDYLVLQKEHAILL